MPRPRDGVTDSGRTLPPLAGLRVIELATILAGPLTGMLLADHGADVIKVEHPRGDPLRTHGPAKGGVGLLWKVIGRNKRTVTLDLRVPDGQELLLRLVAGADVLIENFRPGTLEGWNLGPERLHAANPGLVILRTTGFGQDGPYRRRPGFGTIAEAMSGFAHITGQPDGPPTLPPFGLADGIAGLAGAVAVLTALYHRDARDGAGQVIDVAIYEPILSLLGAQPTVYDQLGIIPGRTGNRSTNNAPRNTYRTADGKWVAISTSAQSVAERVMQLVGRPELIDEPWFGSGTQRAQHADELDEAVAAWIAERPQAEVISAFEAAEAAAFPIYDVANIMADPQVVARESVTELPDPELGSVKMQNVMFRMLGTPAELRWAGRPVGSDNEEVYGEVGIDPRQLAQLHARGVV